MTTAAEPHVMPQSAGWFARAENWMDERGKGAWLVAMILGFIFVWPVGLALLIYMIWSKRMFSKSCRHPMHEYRREHVRAFRDEMRSRHHSARAAMRPSGNTAFDAYKNETLQRLMDEQEQFEAFLDRLRSAKDKQEFDQFMDERAEAAKATHAAGDSDAEDDDVRA